MPYYKWIKKAVITGIVLLGLGIVSNVFGRFSLSGFFGIAAVFCGHSGNYIAHIY